MKNTVQTLFTSNPGYDTLAIRLATGIIFSAHGAQKLFGWFGGHGLEATANWMTSIGLAPGLAMAALAGGVEFFGGLLLILGLAVRPAAALLAFTMAVAIVTVHLPHGLFIANNGYEFGLALLASSLTLALRGAGNLSADRALQRHLATPL